MKAQQLREMSIAAIFGGVLAAIGIGAVFAGNWIKTEATQRELQVRRQALDASGRLARANDESQQIAAYQARYKRYLSMNAIRPNIRPGQPAEQGERLDWIERVVAAREAQALPRAVYSIAARKPYDQGVPVGQGWSLQASRMKLELGLVHEGDFIGYLRRLANPPVGIFRIESCSLQGSKTRLARASTGSAGKGNNSGTSEGGDGNLAAVCEIDWITLVEEAAPIAGAPPRSGR